MVNQIPQVSTPSSLDPQAVNLAKAIRQTETGGNFSAVGKSGEYGAYQFTEPTWNATAQKYGVNVPLKQSTPEQQNEVAYKQIKEWKDAGNNVGQIASMWNAGEQHKDAYLDTSYKGVNHAGARYDVPAYAKSVASAYQTLKNGGQVSVDSNNPSSTANTTPTQTEQSEENGPLFKSSPNDNPFVAGAKAIGNTPGSAFNFAKGVVSSFNPFNIAKNIGEIGNQFGQLAKESGGVGNAITKGLMSLPSGIAQTAAGFIPQGVKQITKGDIAGATKSFTEDPFGQAAPIVLAAEGGANLADNLASKSAMADYVKNIGETYKEPIPKPTTTYSDAFGKTVETIAKPFTKTAEVIGSKVGDLAGGVSKSIISHVTGLDPETIQQVLTNPEAFKKLEQDNISRGGLAGDVQNAIDTRLKDLSEVGKGYDAVRNSNQTIQVPPDLISKTLEDKGFTIKKGKIVADTNSVTRNSSDIQAIQKFYDDWKGKKTLTPNEFLNMRGDIGELSKFDKVTGMGKTRASEAIGKSLYDRANRMIRDPQLQELKALDETYAPEREFLQKVKKDYFNTDGTFKDNAPSKIANAGNKGELLKRLENVMPGITDKIKVLKAVEDIQRASGLKVGTYTRALVGGGGFVLAGIPGFIISEILTSPEAAVPILRKAGYLGAKAGPIIEALKTLVGDTPKKGGGLIKLNASQGGEKSPYTGLLPLNRKQTSTQL